MKDAPRHDRDRPQPRHDGDPSRHWTDGPHIAPPRLARWLLRVALRAEARSAVTGDLDEEFAQFIVPHAGVRRARRWYWNQAWRSVLACRLGLPDPPLHPDQPTLRLAVTQEREAIVTDVRYALRQLGATPLFSALLVLIVALCIGANTAVFSVINALLLRTLPVAHANRLVFVQPPESRPITGGGRVSYAGYLALTRDAAGFEALAATSGTPWFTRMDDGSVRAQTNFVSGNFFETLGVRSATRGRLLVTTDDRPDAPPAVVLSHGFWQRQFGGDRQIVGRVVRLNDFSATVVGVAPPEFFGMTVGTSPDVWVPVTFAPLVVDGPYIRLNDQFRHLTVVGRVAPGSSPDQRLAGVIAAWRQTPFAGEPRVISAAKGHDWLALEHGPRLVVLSGLVALVLIIGCLNIATLLAARGTQREREFGIRAALGAGRGRLLRQLLIEHVLLATIGGAAGLAVGAGLSRSLLAAMSDRRNPLAVDLTLDRHVLLFTLGLSVLTAFAFGLVPALRAARVDLLSALTNRRAGPPAGALSRVLARAGVWWLVPAQIAFGSVVLVAAGLFVKTFNELHHAIGVGHPERVAFANIDFDARRYEGATLRAMYDRVAHALAAIPDVTAAGLSTMRPLSSRGGGFIVIPGAEPPRSTVRGNPLNLPPPPPPPPPGAKAAPALPAGQSWLVGRAYVSPGVFAALGLPMIQGRAFADRDRAGGAPVAIINEALAARAFPQQNPIGRRLYNGPLTSPPIEIVGVVRDLKYVHLRDDAPETVFFPMAQGTWDFWDSDLTIVARTDGDARAVVARIAPAVHELDATLSVSRVWTFGDEISNALIHERLAAVLATAMAALAWILACAGIYGVVSAAVARRTREMGVRLALGATPRRVRAMVIRESLIVVTIGLVAGVPLAYVLTRSVRNQLYGVEPSDPTTAIGAIVLLLLTSVLAAFLPARRASRVDPVVALRAE